MLVVSEKEIKMWKADWLIDCLTSSDQHYNFSVFLTRKSWQKMIHVGKTCLFDGIWMDGWVDSLITKRERVDGVYIMNIINGPPTITGNKLILIPNYCCLLHTRSASFLIHETRHSFTNSSNNKHFREYALQ